MLPGAAALALASHTAVAQDTGTPPAITVVGKAPRGLDAASSTGSNLDVTPMKTPASIEVITQEQLRERGDTSLMDAITRVAGITSLAHPGNSGSALSARGFIDSTSVMRLYDGTRQYGGVGVSFPFDTWSVERIEVLRGPASVIYGDWAIGGVINVIPQKPMRGPVRSEIQATVGTQGKRALDRWSQETLAAVGAHLIHADLQSAQLLTEHDAIYSIYYQRGAAFMYAAAERRLPVLKLSFKDAGETVAYLDPYTGDVSLSLDHSQRLDRWLFNLLHSWDLPAFLHFDIARNAVLTLLSLGGAAIAATGCVIGYRRLRLQAKAGARRSTPARPEAR